MKQKKGVPVESKVRTATYRERLREQGYKRVEVYVTADDVPLVQNIAAALRNGSVVHVSPPARLSDSTMKSPHREDSSMETVSSPWTVASLKAALEASDELAPGELTLSVDEGAHKVLKVGVESAGGLVLFVSIEGEQIITSTVLWPCDEQEDRSIFEEMMLRKHKVFLPLCALSIETIGGRDYYELFGAMSARSVLSSIITEVRTIANNAIELAEELGPTAMAQSA